jgi:anhydro-N-acetylmuramic acid kinase
VASGGDVSLDDVLRLERAVSEEYVKALQESKLGGAVVIGVHGQTIRHLPHEGLTWQLGDANYIAEKLGVPVVMDFRRRDMAAGGEGAPLVPMFHALMMAGHTPPWAVLNIGGVANVTFMDGHGNISASDCGPGVGLLNEWVKEKTGQEFDEGGQLAAAGQVDEGIVGAAVAKIGFWRRPVPRSADRYEFSKVKEWVKDLSTQDGAATLTALTVAGAAHTLRELGGLPDTVHSLLLCGGGAQNPEITAGLRADGWKVHALEATTGWHPQDVEAACFAWLAVRRLRNLSTTLPRTTRCKHPTVGGILTA